MSLTLFFSQTGALPSVTRYRAFLPDSAPTETARLMLTDDTNSMGNVHGGTILKLMEQAGHIVSMRHCNNDPNTQPMTTVLARMNQTDFYQPMHVGEIAQVKAAVTYTSNKSMEVSIDVYAENPMTGTKRHTNSARLWYVAVPADVQKYSSTLQPQAVPQLAGISKEELTEGNKRYEEQKKARVIEDHIISNLSTTGEATSVNHNVSSDPEPGTVAASATTLSSAVLPSDCLRTGHMMGGVLMKIMDSAAAICSVKHCKSIAVTACMDALNFHTPVLLGEVVTAKAKVVFTSRRSLVVEVVCETEGLRSGCQRITNTAYFTFVSLNNEMKAQDVPQLKIMDEMEEKKFNIVKEMYERKKKARKTK